MDALLLQRTRPHGSRGYALALSAALPRNVQPLEASQLAHLLTGHELRKLTLGIPARGSVGFEPSAGG